MAKLPDPNPERLRGIAPTLRVLPKGTVLARIYYAAGDHPTTWNGFRQWGPHARGRFDHHQPDPINGRPRTQARGICYAAPLAITCLAEVFQQSRVINRDAGCPCLAVFSTDAPLPLIDLTGEFATQMGASLAIHSGPRNRTRAWASALYDAYPQAHGLLYLSSMHPGGLALALTERAVHAFPSAPTSNRPLADPSYTDLVDACAQRLGYLKS